MSTLADKVIRDWSSKLYRSRIDRGGWVPRTVAQARKFVLDDEMSAFISDLSYACLPPSSPAAMGKRIVDMLEGQRVASRLPFPTTWIEFNMVARIDRAVEYHAQAVGNREQGPDRVGWLMTRHPKNEQAFMCVQCCSNTFDKRERIDLSSACQLAYVWTTDDSVIPWTTVRSDARGQVAQWMLGHQAYSRGEHVGLVLSPYVAKDFAPYALAEKSVMSVLHEQAGDVRALWALLSTLNDIPTLRADVRPSKGQMVGGSYKRFMDHTVLSLRVPQKVSYRTLARRIARASRRRAHPVRGHWRADWRTMPAALCEHVWREHEGGLVCGACQGHKLWIAEHQRGDASLGFVLHDYAVQRGEV